MTATLEERKIRLRDLLAEIEDEGILLLLEAILNPREDFWDDLSEADKASIERGLEQLDRGERVPYEEVMQKIRRKTFAEALVVSQPNGVGLDFTFGILEQNRAAHGKDISC
jgi:predicted transcriptional regulator